MARLYARPNKVWELAEGSCALSALDLEWAGSGGHILAKLKS